MQISRVNSSCKKKNLIYDPNRFQIDLGLTPDDLALHFNPRFHDDEDGAVLVCNSKTAGWWGDEKREIHNSLKRGGDVKVKNSGFTTRWFCLSWTNRSWFIILFKYEIVVIINTQKHIYFPACCYIQLCSYFAKKKNHKHSFSFRLCWNCLETCLRWSFLTDKKSTFRMVQTWMLSLTSEWQGISNSQASRSTEAWKKNAWWLKKIWI